MIDITNISFEIPFQKFKVLYNEALKKKQSNIEAMCLSSYDADEKKVDSRFVNLKYIINDELIFFTNYKSPKSIQMNNHIQVSACFFWHNINLQIRVKGLASKCDETISDQHFSKRSIEKNNLAIISRQSQKANSYQEILEYYEKMIHKLDYKKRPKYWGGFSIKPYSIEFWHGNDARINERNLYTYDNKKWKHTVLQP